MTTNDTSHFLPNKYESVHATQFGQAHFGQLKNASAVLIGIGVDYFLFMTFRLSGCAPAMSASRQRLTPTHASRP